MAIGIICEYNPFHAGHTYQLSSARAMYRERHPDSGAADVVCIMSPSFVQRGEPAIYDKWTRARAAIENGASMVLELPGLYALGSAPEFAMGGVHTAKACGIIDALSFGVESTALDIEALAATLYDRRFELSNEIHKILKKIPALPYAVARFEAIKTLCPQYSEESLALLKEPNCILALEYLLACKELNWAPELLQVNRKGASHNETASRIREELRGSIIDMDVFTGAFYSELLRVTGADADASALLAYPGISGGLEDRILAQSKDYPPLSELLSRLATKQYPNARLRRVLMYIALGITNELRAKTGFDQGPGYIRVLAVKKNRMDLLSRLCREATLPVVVSPTDALLETSPLSESARAMLLEEFHLTDFYNAASNFSGFGKEGTLRGQDFKQGLLIVE